jgi:hypothetical protein
LSQNRAAVQTTGEPNDADQGNLIIGERTIDRAIEILGNSAIRIAVFHHPIHWLHDPDQAAVASRLQAEFDILMFGHVHRASPELLRTISGEVIASQGSCLYNSREYFNGYNIVRIYPDASSVEIAVQEYSDHLREFIPATRLLKDPVLKFSLPSRDSREVSPLISLLLKVKPNIRNLANKHISVVGGSGEPIDLDTHFVCPQLTSGTPASLRSEATISPTDKIDSILRDNKSIIIIGRSEAGKTSLGHYLAVQAASGGADELRLPLLAHFSDLHKGDRNLWRLLRDYANEISDNSISRSLLEKEPLLVIVDDVDLLDIDRTEILTTLIATHKNVRWILLATSPAGGLSLSPVIAKQLPGFEVATISELSRKAIRALSGSWIQPGNDDKDKADALYRSVMEQIQRTGLPRSGYIVSLILWAIKNKSRGELLNEAVLLQNIIDYMLGRMDYTGALRSDLDFTTKSSILQHLAMHFKETMDIHEKNDVLQFIIGLLDKKGLKYDAAGLLNSFINCGIVDELGTTVSFRYRRFQDFFVAGHLRDSPGELKNVVENRYFDFTKELDLFTARFRHESSFLDIGKKYLEAVPVTEPKLSGAKLTEYLTSGDRLDFSERQLAQMRKEPMTADKVDELLDKTERRVAEKQAIETGRKKQTGVDKKSVVVKFFIALELYGQFIRNLEFIDKEEKQTHLRECFLAWEKALRGTFSVFAEVVQELKKDIPDDKSSADPIKKVQIVKLVDSVETILKSLFPTTLADMAYHTLGSEKLIEFIDELASEAGTSNTYKLLCLFVLLELSPERGLDRLRTLIELDNVDNWVLSAVTQRLFAYYRTRPLSDRLRGEFENLVADVQIRLAGGKIKKSQRGAVLTKIKEQAFRDAPPK